MKLNYEIKIVKYTKEEGGGYRVSIPLLGDAAFVADGDTIEEALSILEEVKEGIFRHWIDIGAKIPEPRKEPDDDYSGKFIVRVPSELHRKLAEEAQKQKISLNSYINYLLTTNLSFDQICQKMETQIRSTFKEAIESVNFESMRYDISDSGYYSNKDDYKLAG